MMSPSLRAPFPYFGGKRRVAAEVWARFGDVHNYVEPFAGSLAVLLGRPHPAHIETVNDRDSYLACFWRAVQADPDAVARYADWPVNEADLHARHLWLLQQVDFRERMLTDPEFYDVKIAGWWVWGICCWIGSGWCSWERGKGGASRQLPHMGNAGRGVHRQLPHMGGAGRNLQDYMIDLANRIRRVRVACGDWSRVLGDSVTWRHGTTGVFLDPPYDDGKIDYGAGGRGVSADVREWCLAHGSHPKLRIALCGYEGEHEMPPEWSVVAWKASGGYGSQGQGDGRDNAARERIWFSPHCLKPRGGNWQTSIFDSIKEAP